MTLKNLALALGAVTCRYGRRARRTDNMRVRGTVYRIRQASTLTVKTHKGQSDAIKLSARLEGFRRRQGLARRHQGRRLCGIASAPAADGSEGALEVVIFPAALKGTGEGSPAMDVKPTAA